MNLSESNAETPERRVRIVRPAFQDMHLVLPRLRSRSFEGDGQLFGNEQAVGCQRTLTGGESLGDVSMTQVDLQDNPQTVELLQAMKRMMQWMQSMETRTRQRFLASLAECSDDLQEVVFRMVSVLENPQSAPFERKRALMTIADSLFLNPDHEGDYGMDLVASEAQAAMEHPQLAAEVKKMNSQEAAFATQLSEIMKSKKVTQKDLADRIGCSQPAISQMLNRKCRPQKRTILKLADALGVRPQDLWTDLEVAEMLDAVASFDQDDYVMTEAEAESLRDRSKRNAPKIPVRSLPSRN